MVWICVQQKLRQHYQTSTIAESARPTEKDDNQRPLMNKDLEKEIQQ